MKALAYLLVGLSLVWIDVAYRAATARTEVVIIKRVTVESSSQANYIVPVQECANVCRARARSFATSMKFKEGRGK